MYACVDVTGNRIGGGGGWRDNDDDDDSGVVVGGGVYTGDDLCLCVRMRSVIFICTRVDVTGNRIGGDGCRDDDDAVNCGGVVGGDGGGDDCRCYSCMQKYLC